MAEGKKMTARYEVLAENHGNRYRFFCEASQAVICTTQPIREKTPKEELELAWKSYGRRYFNQCQQCGKWVCNVMYNPDVLKCVDCSPVEQLPKYCQRCGTPVLEASLFCRQCGMRLMYGEVNDV